jgi:hypothetical protein
MTTPSTATATPGIAMAAGTGSGASSSGSSNPIGGVFVEVAGVIILSLVAGIGPRVGKIVTLFMAGIFVLWLVLHASTLAKLLPGSNVTTQG